MFGEFSPCLSLIPSQATHVRALRILGQVADCDLVRTRGSTHQVGNYPYVTIAGPRSFVAEAMLLPAQGQVDNLSENFRGFLILSLHLGR